MEFGQEEECERVEEKKERLAYTLHDMRLFIFFVLLFLSLRAELIQIQDKILEVEIADTHAKRVKGLQFRRELKNGAGMLFIFPEPIYISMWMKDTYIPLSVAFFSEDKKLLHFVDMDPPLDSNFKRYKSKAPAKYALEVPQKWFEKNQIHPGSKFAFVN